jgi:hypothetical protein
MPTTVDRANDALTELIGKLATGVLISVSRFARAERSGASGFGGWCGENAPPEVLLRRPPVRVSTSGSSG